MGSLPLPAKPFRKTPEELLIRGLDFAEHGLAPGEILAPRGNNPPNAVIIEPAGELTADGGLMWAYSPFGPVTIGDRVFAGDDFDRDDPTVFTKVGVRLAGGRLNVTYEVRVRVSTSRGQVLEACFQVDVVAC